MEPRVRGVVDHWSSRVGFGAWRKAPRPGYSASDRPAGARSAGTAGRSIPCDAERADSPDRDSTEDRHARARRERLDAESALRRVARVPALPRRHCTSGGRTRGWRTSSRTAVGILREFEEIAGSTHRLMLTRDAVMWTARSVVADFVSSDRCAGCYSGRRSRPRQGDTGSRQT